VLDRQPARPLCLVSCRAPATCRRRHVTETEPTTPRASHPVRTLHQTAPGDRRTPSFVCGIEKCHVGDRDRLFGSSFSTSTGHRKRNPRAALRNARALPSGASLSARETASEGAGRSQITESGQHYLTTTDRPPKPRNHCGRNPKFMTKLRFLISNNCLEKMKFRNQLYATRDRVESYRMKRVDSPLDSPASHL